MASSARLGLAVLAIAAGPLLAACSDGGPSPTGAAITSPPPPPVAAPPPPPPPVSSAPTFTAGVFEASGEFEAQCETPRSGVDIEGNGFPDEPGSTLLENFWLRSWTNETYLWNDEVVDRDPAGFNDRLAYFAQLRTFAVEPSGEDRDDFHFSEPTEEFLARRNSAPSASYGYSLLVFSNTPPRDYRIRYTEPDSPAAEAIMGQPQFQRGTRILEVDGVDLVNGGATQAEIDTLNNGLFPATAGETHTFVVQDPGAASTRTVTITSADISPKPVNRFSVIDTPTGKVGYLLFNTFSPFESERDLAEAMSSLAAEGVEDLVLDLRYNGGGLLAVAAQLGYMIAGDAQTSGRTFELLRFNDDAGNVNPVTGEFNSPVPFYDTGLGFSLVNGAPLDSLDLPRVFILSTAGTCSASEAVINGLRGVGVSVILVGDVTCGKPYGFYPTDNCGETYYTIQFQGVNDQGFGEYADGFVPEASSFGFGVRLPGCVVADDINTELGDTSEALLAAALTYRDTGDCSPPAATALAKLTPQTAYRGAEKGALATTAATPAEDFLNNNRDMRMPY
ncbi:MAG: S41 family peptidase [Pseudomonadota bacterium]